MIDYAHNVKLNGEASGRTFFALFAKKAIACDVRFERLVKCYLSDSVEELSACVVCWGWDVAPGAACIVGT
jgi:hypothetical protein